MLDYFLIGMISAVSAFVGSVLSKDPHVSEFLSDMSFLVMYAMLAVCCSQMICNSLKFSAKNPGSVMVMAATVLVGVLAMATCHNNKLVMSLANSFVPLKDTITNYASSFWRNQQTVVKGVKV
ncbi:hypothetical protein RvY_17479 [Ramazzottius varieornatus]|uniref:Uncharacterized protein n=1 Tax=Ramazzottius varieornatus TaxID=947166 RepID=A0A1D1W823_RAMVA|nr:hypothetical protein RvY_17479 [Ramazzottius varieornatus]